MLNLKCTIIPVIIGASGIVTRSLRKNLEDVPGKHSIDSLQKTAILGTSHIRVIRKVLRCETQTMSGGDHRWFKRSTEKKRPSTRDDNNNNIAHNVAIISPKWRNINDRAAEERATLLNTGGSALPMDYCILRVTKIRNKNVCTKLQQLLDTC
jgi:hypothetical protein